MEGIINIGSGKPTQIFDIVNALRAIHKYPLLELNEETTPIKFYSKNEKLKKITDLTPPNILDELQQLTERF